MPLTLMHIENGFIYHTLTHIAYKKRRKKQIDRERIDSYAIAECVSKHSHLLLLFVFSSSKWILKRHSHVMCTHLAYKKKFEIYLLLLLWFYMSLHWLFEFIWMWIRVSTIRKHLLNEICQWSILPINSFSISINITSFYVCFNKCVIYAFTIWQLFGK